MKVGIGGATSNGEQVWFACVVLALCLKLDEQVCGLACLSSRFHVLLNEMKVGIGGTRCVETVLEAGAVLLAFPMRNLFSVRSVSVIRSMRDWRQIRK